MATLALTVQGRTEYLPDQPPHSNEAMRRYWEAKQSGDETANLVRTDAPNPPPPDDDEPPPSAPVAALPVPSGTVSPTALERIQIQETWLKEAGFALAPPIFAPGTRVLPLGDENFRLERARVERLPAFPEAAARVRAAVSAEGRVDHTLRLADLRMNDDGTLPVMGDDCALEFPAFLQLALLGGFGMGARYLAERCTSSLRATNVNDQVAKAGDREVVIRSRATANGRQAFAVVTPTYAAVDTHEVLDLVGPALADARVEMLYDGTGIRATALWMPDEVVDLAAGDVFKVGVRVRTDDTGRGRIRISGVAFRNRCLNLIIIDEGEVDAVNLVHRGDPERIRGLVAKGVEKARASVASFLTAWGHARTVHTDPMKALRRLVDDRKVVPPAKRDDALAALRRAWEAEPGDTVADVANAVTRAAHEELTWNYDFRENLERAAAQMVLVPR